MNNMNSGKSGKEKSVKDVLTVAAIDCGTNSIKMIIADTDSSGNLFVRVPRIMRVVRLGQNVDVNRRFSCEALNRTYEAVREFAQIIEQHDVDVVSFVATSATRDARNREEFEDEIEKILSVRPEVISGLKEAQLSFSGAVSVIDAEKESSHFPCLVIDLGGGSTEFVLGRRDSSGIKVDKAFSADMGSVRITERYLHGNPASAEEEKAAKDEINRWIDRAFEEVPVQEAKTIIGVSGTVATLAAINRGMKEYDRSQLDGLTLGIGETIHTCTRVLNMTFEQRKEMNIIHPDRIDVMGGGAIVWREILRRIGEKACENGSGPNSYTVSEHGLLEGIARDVCGR